MNTSGGDLSVYLLPVHSTMVAVTPIQEALYQDPGMRGTVVITTGG